jgi:hypothetical protein
LEQGHERSVDFALASRIEDIEPHPEGARPREYAAVLSKPFSVGRRTGAARGIRTPDPIITKNRGAQS